MIKVKFPHFHLKNPARVGTVVDISLRWGLLALFIGANIFWLQPQDVPSVLGAQSEKREQLTYWQQVARKHPDYKDALLMVARHAYELGEDEIAREAGTKVLGLDPNNTTADFILSSLPSFPPAP